MSSFMPILHQVHRLNHIRYKRVCNLSSAHTVGLSITKQLTYSGKDAKFTNLNAGIYTISIAGKTYVFDLYKSLSGNDVLVIHDANYAYMKINTVTYLVNLYELIGRNNSESHYTLNDTVNDYIDMIVLDGMTDIVYSGKLAYPTFDNPSKINSISSFILTTTNSNDGNKEDLNISLKNNIKSLSNGVKDTFILNAEQQQHHIIFRIGRTILSGNEAWEIVEAGCSDKYTLFKCKDSNVKLEDSANNLNCSHFQTKQGSDIVKASSQYNGIATTYGSYGNGFFLKVSTDIVPRSTNELSKLLTTKLLSDSPVIVEYPLAQYRYKTVLLDEYYIKTRFPSTVFKIDYNYSISYFYKSVHV